MSVQPLTILTEEEQMFREQVRDFARKEVAPLVAEMDANAKMEPSLFPKLFENGFMGVEVPEAYDGPGGTFFESILAIEALAAVDPSVSVMVDVQNTLVNNALINYGNDEQKAKYLPRMVNEWIGSYCLSEASSGSDAFALKMTATKDGDRYLLNGSKLWITNGDEADLFLVMANVDPDLPPNKRYKGITTFIVERGFPGLHIGKKEDKLGIRASSTVELSFDNCEVPVSNVLGQVGKGYKIAIETLNEGRIGIGAQMVGLAQGAFDFAMKYMLEREQFGQAIALFQGMEFQYAQLAVDIEAARLLVYNAARLKDAGRPFIKQAAMAKLYSSAVAEKTASLAIEFCGGVGFTKEYPPEKFYRDAKIGKIYEGTSNMQLKTIAGMLRDEYA